MQSSLNQEWPSDIPPKEKMDKAEFEIIVRKSMQGDKEALALLCQVSVKDILFRTTYLLRSQMDAEDAAQEILIRVCKKIQDLKEPKAFNFWLSSIIINESNRYMAKHYKKQEPLDISDYTDVVVEDDDDFLPQEYVEKSEYRKIVMEIIDQLPGQQRKSILLYYYDGLTVSEAAKILGVSRSNISRSLMLARKKIGLMLEKKINRK